MLALMSGQNFYYSSLSYETILSWMSLEFITAYIHNINHFLIPTLLGISSKLAMYHSLYIIIDFDISYFLDFFLIFLCPDRISITRHLVKIPFLMSRSIIMCVIVTVYFHSLTNSIICQS